MIRFSFSLVLLVLMSTSIAMAMSADEKRNRHKIMVHADHQVGLYVSHTIMMGQTVYSISRMYHTTVSDIVTSNQDIALNDLKIGYDLIIPIDPKMIAPKVAYESDAQEMYYRVKSGETLYGISKHYFDQEVGHIKELNNLNSESLQPGQILLIGYMMPKGQPIEPVDPIEVNKPIEIGKNVSKRVLIDRHGHVYLRDKAEAKSGDEEKKTAVYKMDEKSSAEMVKTNGTAFWNRADYKSEGRFVLHRTAKVNSIVEITNPMSKKTVRAKVIGELPYNLYSPEIDIVVSPELAKELKVLDSKFFVQMRYLPR